MQSNNIYEPALKNAIASVEMEGYEFEEAQKKECLDFVSGKISKEDFIKLLLERCRA